MYNGYKNNKTWRVAMQINGGGGEALMRFCREFRGQSYTALAEALQAFWGPTCPDGGFSWTDPQLCRTELTDVLKRV